MVSTAAVYTYVRATRRLPTVHTSLLLSTRCFTRRPSQAPASTTIRSLSSSFFHYTSGRARKRRRRRRLRQSEATESSSLAAEASAQQMREDEEDSRTVGDLLFANPHKDESDPYAQERLPLPRSPAEFFKVWNHAVGQYRESWIGFWTQRGFLIQDPPGEHDGKEEQTDQKQHPQEAMLDNAKRNAAFVQEEAENLKRTVRDQTGIHSAQDLRNVLGDAMQLAADCVQEFMAGYRKVETMKWRK